MIAKRFYYLRKFYDEYGLGYLRSRYAKDQFTKTALYKLRPFLSYDHWSPEIDPQGEYSDKLSNYWRVTEKGLIKLQELFPEDEELNDRIGNDLAMFTKKVLVK